MFGLSGVATINPKLVCVDEADAKKAEGDIIIILKKFLPRDATQRAVMPRYVVRLSV